MNFETYDSDYGVGYRILVNGVVVVDQPFKPNTPGFVGMTQAEAEAAAAEQIAAMPSDA